MNSGGEEDLLRFRQELTRLKQHGSATLVVGDAPPEAHRRLCHQILSGETATRRIVVETGADYCVTPDATRGSDSEESTTRLRYRTATRSTQTAAQPTTEPTLPWQVGRSSADEDGNDDEAETLVELGRSLDDAVTAATADATEPAALRLCLDSLHPLLEDATEEAVFRFLHVFTHHARSVTAMAHVHLPVDRDARLVRLVRPLFDAVVELRHPQGHPEQRWELIEADVTTRWLPVESL